MFSSLVDRSTPVGLRHLWILQFKMPQQPEKYNNFSFSVFIPYCWRIEIWLKAVGDSNYRRTTTHDFKFGISEMGVASRLGSSLGAGEGSGKVRQQVSALDRPG